MGVIQELEKFADRMPESGVRHSIMQTVHVLRYPMKDILAKVPGDTLKDRAKAIGVSRQTMYVWGHEKFRPSNEQAETISRLTGVPVWQIRDLQETDNDLGTAPSAPPEKLARRGKAASRRHGRLRRTVTRPKRAKRVVDAQG